MSMLAERKQKIKWCLNPQGNLWSNDDSKFGQRLLEKMGWRKGKGLGKDEDGKVDIIKVRVKNDNTGIGFTENGENWTSHNEDYENLLSNLQEQASQGITTTELSVSNLELKSKNSKKRIHYHKFVRGKDLSKYSSKDLKSIFGKKDSFSFEVKANEIESPCENDEYLKLNGNKNGKVQMVDSAESKNEIKIRKRKHDDSEEIYDSEFSKTTDTENGREPKKRKRKENNSSDSCDSQIINGHSESETVDDVEHNLSEKRKRKRKSVTFIDGDILHSDILHSPKNLKTHDNINDILENNDSKHQYNNEEALTDDDQRSFHMEKKEATKKQKKTHKLQEENEFNNHFVYETKDRPLELTNQEIYPSEYLNDDTTHSKCAFDDKFEERPKRHKKNHKHEKENDELDQCCFDKVQNNSSVNHSYGNQNLLQRNYSEESKDITSYETPCKSNLGNEVNGVEEANIKNEFSKYLPKAENKIGPVDKKLWKRWIKKANVYVGGTPKGRDDVKNYLRQISTMWEHEIIKTTNLFSVEGYPR